MTLSRAVSVFVSAFILISMASQTLADPRPDEALKFYQMPLNNGFTPYLVPSPPTRPHTDAYGTVPSTAIFPGHDELSTAIRTSPNTPWQGRFMADDFADHAGTPINHVRWWGSYMGQQPTESRVRRFLISFEHNVPASVDPLTGAIIPSHPDPTHPDNLHQIVDLFPGMVPPPPGMFTEKPVPTPAGPVPPIEPLFEYNAELHLDKWFKEEAASTRNRDAVYWLKIVALVDAQEQGVFEWGWHNRDWSIPNALAAVPGETPDGAEHIAGFVPGATGAGQPVWHFEDDAVSGSILVFPTPMPNMPLVEQFGFAPENYLPPLDGPTPIIQFSKDLAFELYTLVPEPASIALFALGAFALLGLTRRR